MEVDHLIPDMPGVIRFLESQLGDQRKCDWNLTPAKSDFSRSSCRPPPRVPAHSPFHISIQSGCTTVLKRMRRLYTAEHTSEVIERLKKDIPNIAITTDLIAGFPGETEEEFQQNLDFVKRHELAKVHAFPYSVRANTLAAKMKNQVDSQEKRRRMKLLQELANKHRQKFIESQLGQSAQVVCSQPLRPDYYDGLTDHYARVRKKSQEDLAAKMTEEVLDKSNVVRD